MDLTLRRQSFTDQGVFGLLLNDQGDTIAVTLEHAYDRAPKVPPGEYKCVRGLHRLEGMKEPFETFEVTGVPGHSNILLHVGNYQRDSHGCILVGTEILGEMITQSRVAFEKFMELQKGVDQFTLTVKA